MRVSVTGATGFLGSYLTRKLVERGDEVTILRRTSSNTLAIEDLPLRHVIGDVSQIDSVMETLRNAEMVFHVAGLIGYWKKIRHTQQLVNVQGTKNIVAACLQLGVPKLVHTSSIVTIGYSSHGEIRTENSTYNAAVLGLAYFTTKYLAEQEIMRGVARGLQAVIVNPSVILGPFVLDPNSSRILEHIAQRKIPFIPPGGINVVGVDDVVKGHLLAAKKGRAGERYILGGENYYYRELFAKIASLAGVAAPKYNISATLTKVLFHCVQLVDHFVNLKPPYTPEMFRMLPLTFFGSSQKAQEELNYQAAPIEGIMQSTLDFLRIQGKIR